MVVQISRCLFVIAISLVTLLTASAAEVVTIGVLAHRGDSFARARWEPTIAYLGERLEGYEFKLRPLSLEGVQAALEGGRIDFLLTNPGHFNGISDDFRLTQVASLKTDRRGKPTTGNRYGAVIFVRASRSDIRTLGDLKGKSFAAVAPDAFGGYLAAAYTLQRNGIEPERDLGAIKYLGFPQDEIVLAVINGDEDAGTVRTGILESMIADGRISAGDIRVINPQTIDGFDLLLSTELFPEWTFVSTASTSSDLRKKVAQVLFEIDENTKAAQAGRYGGWNTPMYDGRVRELLEAVRKTGIKAPVNNIYWLAAVVVVMLLIAGFAVYYQKGSGKLFVARRRANAKQKQFLRLTPRENEVLTHVVSGKTNKEVARELDISPKTVEFHRKHLMKKLDAENLADLVRIAIERENLAE